jgi:hypothetical protein
MIRPAPATPAELRALAADARRIAREFKGSLGVSVLRDDRGIRVRFAQGTHIARGEGIVASATSSSGAALIAWAGKAEARADRIEGRA